MERVFDINQSGNSIKAKIYCDDLRNIDRVILYGHGFGGHKELKTAQKFAQKVLSKYKKVAILIFDLPAHGQDVKKKFYLQDCLDYLDIVFDYCHQQLNAKDIYGYATSFSSYLYLVYTHLHDHPFKKLVLRSSAIKMRDIMMSGVIKRDDLDKLNKGKDIKLGHDHNITTDMHFFDEMKENDVSEWEYFDNADDILFIHGTKDDSTPLEDVVEFSENNVIEVKIIENADHPFRDPVKLELANKYAMEFMEL